MSEYAWKQEIPMKDGRTLRFEGVAEGMPEVVSILDASGKVLVLIDARLWADPGGNLELSRLALGMWLAPSIEQLGRYFSDVIQCKTEDEIYKRMPAFLVFMRAYKESHHSVMEGFSQLGHFTPKRTDGVDPNNGFGPNSLN